MVVGLALFVEAAGVLLIRSLLVGLGYLLKLLVIDGFRLHMDKVELAFLLKLSNKRVALG